MTKDMTRKKGGCLWAALGMAALFVLSGGCLTLLEVADFYRSHAEIQSKASAPSDRTSVDDSLAELYELQYPDIDSTREAFLDKKKWLMPHLKNRTARRIMQKIANSYKCCYYNDRWGIRAYYPACFKAGELPLNGDGCSFSMGHGIFFVVSGGYNILEYSLQKYFKEDKKELGKRLIYSKFNENYYIIAGKCPKGIVLHGMQKARCSMEYWSKKMFVNNKNTSYHDAFVNFTIYYPTRYKMAVKNMIDYEERNFMPE